jgi:hypothetical protein
VVVVVVVVVVDVVVDVVVLVVLVDVVLVDGLVDGVLVDVVLVEVAAEVASEVVLVDTAGLLVVDGAADGAVTASPPSLHAASRIDASASSVCGCACRRVVTPP